MSLEIVENAVEDYQRNYIFNNFRRYRHHFSLEAYQDKVFNRYFRTIGKQYQALFYQLWYRPSFSYTFGPAGFGDMFAASIVGMNFFAGILAQPEVGTFVYDPASNTFRAMSPECRDAAALAEEGLDVVGICLGEGKPYWSAWETGYYGQFDRLARIGTSVDKLMAVVALTTRDWGVPRFNDETFPLNFYNGFQDEILSLFSGIITDAPHKWAALRAFDGGEPSSERGIEYRDMWAGKFFGTEMVDMAEVYGIVGTGLRDAGPEMRYCLERAADGSCARFRPTVEPAQSSWLQIYALFSALVTFGSFWDTNYVQYMRLKCYTPEEVRNRCSGCVENGGDGSEIEYTSLNYGITCRAPQTEDGKSITYTLLARARAVHDEYLRVAAVDPDAPPDDIFDSPACRQDDDAETCKERRLAALWQELERRDSFLNVANDLIERLGLAW